MIRVSPIINKYGRITKNILKLNNIHGQDNIKLDNNLFKEYITKLFKTEKLSPKIKAEDKYGYTDIMDFFNRYPTLDKSPRRFAFQYSDINNNINLINPQKGGKAVLIPCPGSMSLYDKIKDHMEIKISEILDKEDYNILFLNTINIQEKQLDQNEYMEHRESGLLLLKETKRLNNDIGFELREEGVD